MRFEFNKYKDESHDVKLGINWNYFPSQSASLIKRNRYRKKQGFKEIESEQDYFIFEFYWFNNIMLVFRIIFKDLKFKEEIK